MIDSQDRVVSRYSTVFQPDHLAELTEEEFRAFLIFENNTHWTGLHRQGPRMCADMDRLRAGLRVLQDPELRLGDRLERATGDVPGMGKGIATAILTVCNPQECGVWNSTSEAGLVELGLYPAFDRGTSFGEKYERINEVLLHLARILEVDLWTLDALWWRLIKPVGPSQAPEGGDTPEETTSLRFGLERHLHEFLRENWDNTDLARDGWKLFAEGGDETAGYEYACAVGRIDLLAKHKKDDRWLIIELKRNHTADQAVGQVLRYMGWIRANLAATTDTVEGLIIGHAGDVGLRYALQELPKVHFKRYEVDFRLIGEAVHE